MADLFDMRIGGAGWHLTSHLIAIAALFVACFAITGYITFREDSVPGSALKDQVNLEDINADTLDLTGAATIGGTLAVTGNVDIGGELAGYRREVINLTAAGSTELTVAQSGALITLDGGANVVLPKITTADIGVSYTFLFLGGTDASAITTSGIAALSDDFVPGSVPVAATGLQTSGDFIASAAIPADANTLTLDDTAAATTVTENGTQITCTAIAASAAAANVWMVSGFILSDVVTGTHTAIFTAA